MSAPDVASPQFLAPGANRLIVYALTDVRKADDAYVHRALTALRALADAIVVIVVGPGGFRADRLNGLVDEVLYFGPGPFSLSMYARALELNETAAANADEIVLTGDGWFGPSEAGLSPIVQHMASQAVHTWELVEGSQRPVQGFADQGFPEKERPALWLAFRGPLTHPSNWGSAASPPTLDVLRGQGYSTAAVFESDAASQENPAVHNLPHLLAAGCPIVPSLAFTLYPPYLQQHAVIGREALEICRARGFDMDEILSALSRDVPPKALNANLGLLNVLDAAPVPPLAAQRIAVLAHITDFDVAGDLIERIDHLPSGYDLFVTTTDGRKAARIRKLLLNQTRMGFRRFEVRVTPASRGRDMSDMFIACRDVLLSDAYEIVVKVHARPMRSKTRLVRSYFRRYQLDNLLGSVRQAEGILSMFEIEPGLGLAFPPMIHIGYQTMGRAWGPYRAAATRLASSLGIRVPLDVVSPLAPFGGMFYARTAALRTLAEHDWSYVDYGPRGDRKYAHLARVQERLLVPAAAERGYHTRTVMTAEHAEISHTALEYKADQLFSTTSGYPVDQITLLHRAGRTGRGGIVGLSRMYLRLNHPRLARVVLPVFALAEAAFLFSKSRAARVTDRLRNVAFSGRGI